MPVELIITKKDLGVDKRLAGMIRRTKDLTPAMKIIGEIGLTSIQRNFELGGRPKKWDDLKEATKKQRQKQRKWPGLILVRKKHLLGSIIYRPYRRKVVWTAGGPAAPYAAIQHFGGMAGRGRKVKIPARPYMVLQREDKKEMRLEIIRYVTG